MTHPEIKYLDPDPATPPMRVEVGLSDQGKLGVTIHLGEVIGPLQGAVVLLETAAQLMRVKHPNSDEYLCRGYAGVAQIIDEQAEALRRHGMEAHNADSDH